MQGLISAIHFPPAAPSWRQLEKNGFAGLFRLSLTPLGGAKVLPEILTLFFHSDAQLGNDCQQIICRILMQTCLGRVLQMLLAEVFDRNKLKTDWDPRILLLSVVI